jgi:hypothetical protein
MSGVDIWLIVMGVFFTLAGPFASSIHLGMPRSNPPAHTPKVARIAVSAFGVLLVVAGLMRW